MIDSNILVGLLSGSLATLIVKEILNQINKRQDFNRDLKKITYIKKLEKAENAIAVYWTYLNKVIEIKKSFEVVIRAINELNEKDNDLEIIQGVLNKSGEAITDLTGEKYSSINAIHLYFELEDAEKWNEGDIENFLKSLSETKSIDKEIAFWIGLQNEEIKLNNERQAEIFWNKALELLPSYVNSLQNVIDCLERNKKATFEMVQAIKRQLQRY